MKTNKKIGVRLDAIDGDIKNIDGDIKNMNNKIEEAEQVNKKMEHRLNRLERNGEGSRD